MSIENIPAGLVVLDCKTHFNDAIPVREIRWLLRNRNASQCLQEHLGDIVSVRHCDWEEYPLIIKLRCYLSGEQVIAASEPEVIKSAIGVRDQIRGMHMRTPTDETIRDMLSWTGNTEDLAELRELYAKYNSDKFLTSLEYLVELYAAGENRVPPVHCDVDELLKDGLIAESSAYRQGLVTVVTRQGGKLAHLAMHCSQVVPRVSRLYPEWVEG